jgi:hypothetical protein
MQFLLRSSFPEGDPMSGKSKFFSLVMQHGGHEIRRKNHRVFCFPNGVLFVVSKTPSDHRSWENAHSKLRRALGLAPQKAHVGLRRARQIKHRQTDRLKLTAIADSQKGSVDFEKLMEAQGVKKVKWR